MKRQAIINSHTLGAINAYRMIIKDISVALGDPVVDMQRLFYAVMIQSGIELFQAPERPSDKLSIPPALSERFSPISFKSIDPTLANLHQVVAGAMISDSCTDAQRRKVDELAFFLADLYVAAAFRRPVVTSLELPEIASLQGVLREDMLLGVSGLLKGLHSITVETPLTKIELPKRQLLAFQDVLQSDLFSPYVESQASLENSCSDLSTVNAVARNARKLVDAFPVQLDLKRTSIKVLHTLPAALDLVAGKAFGEATKPLISMLEAALSHERKLLVYSFYPVWRQIWDAKLEKVRRMPASE